MFGRTVCVPLQLPSLEWLLLDAASCSGAASGPATPQHAEQSAAAAAPAVDPGPAADKASDWPIAAQVPHGTTAAEAAEAPTEEAAEDSSADAKSQGATAFSATAADNSIAGASSATCLQSALSHCVDSPPVSITCE